MRLLQADIRGFGRLVDRSFELCPEVQIIIGANEAGKSTLQQFLLAMLFGMKREDRKRRDYLPQYELYLPWSAAPYEGRLVYMLSDGQRFEIQRVFDREREGVVIRDAITQRDLTDEFPMDTRKERLLMQSQLELTRKLFEATTSMGQLAGKPASEGVGALRERIQGLLDSGDEEVSAAGALASLQRLRESLGSDRTPTRGIGLLQREKQMELGELQVAESRHTEILELHKRRTQVLQQHAAAERAWRQKMALERARERDELARRMRAADNLEQRLEVGRQHVETYSDVAELECASYPPARERASVIAALQQQIEAHEARCGVLQQRANELVEVEGKLSELLGGMDRERSRRLQVAARKLQEEIGRVREVRRRHAQEQLENRAVVESLRKHHGRDWTRDDFMAQWARHRDVVEEIEIEPVRMRADEQGRLYRRLKMSLIVGATVGALIVSGLALAAWLWGAALPLAVRVGTPLVAALSGLLLAPARLQRLLGLRDHARALQAQVARILEHRKEAREWLHEVLQRNNLERAEELQVKRREYESLRAQAERSASESHAGELLEHEKELKRLAQLLHEDVGRCDLTSLRQLMHQPSDQLRSLLPYGEDGPAGTVSEEDPAELRHLLEDLAILPEIQRSYLWLERLRGERAKVEEQLESQGRERDERTAELEGVQAALQSLLQRNGARSIEEFAKRVERYREREHAIAEYVALQREQSGVLGGESLGGLRARLRVLQAELRPDDALGGISDYQAEVDQGVFGEAGPATDPQAQAPLEELRQEVERLAAVRAQLEERLLTREREGRAPAEIELHLQELDRRLEEARQRDEALVLASRTIESVASALHREVAPHMNARVGEIFAQLSRGEHSEVHLDEDLTPHIRMEGGSVHGAESLSGGAADQLYFAMRITAGEQLARSGERLPLLLDDPFVQYDPGRLDAALDLVTEFAQQHQVLFFTCEQEQGEALAERVRARSLDCSIIRL